MRVVGIHGDDDVVPICLRKRSLQACFDCGTESLIAFMHDNVHRHPRGLPGLLGGAISAAIIHDDDLQATVKMLARDGGQAREQWPNRFGFVISRQDDDNQVRLLRYCPDSPHIYYDAFPWCDSKARIASAMRWLALPSP